MSDETSGKRELSILVLAAKRSSATKVTNLLRDSGVFLKKTPIQAEVIQDEREAAVHAMQARASCVLLDWNLPDHGLVALQQISFSHPSVSVLMVMARNKKLREQVFAGGAEDYLLGKECSGGILPHAVLSAHTRHRAMFRCLAEQQRMCTENKRLTDMVEMNPDGMLVVSDDGNTLHCNDAAVLLLDRPRKDIMSNPLGFPVSPGDIKDVEVRGVSGESKVVSVRVTEIPWNGFNGFLVSLRDVSARKMKEYDLEHTIRSERLVTAVSSLFLGMDDNDIDYGIKDALRLVGDFTRADRCLVYLPTDEGDSMTPAYYWQVSGDESKVEERVWVESLEWLLERLAIFETVLVSDPNHLPREAQNEREWLTERGVSSMIAVSLAAGPENNGFLVLESLNDDRVWNEENVGLLKIVGEMIHESLKRSLSHVEICTSRQLLERVMDSMESGIVVFDAERGVLHVSQRLCEMFEVFTPPEEFSGKPVFDILNTLNSRISEPEHFIRFVDSIQQAGIPRTGLKLHLLSGRIFSASYEPVISDSTLHGHYWSFMDVTERSEQKQQLESLVRRDVVTGLSNRQRFFEDVALSLKNGEQGQQAALILIDLDNFRSVNITLGYATGDEVLRQAAERLQECLGGEDLLGRVGGDDFTIFTIETTDRTEAEHLARKVVWALSRPFLVGNHAVEIGASIGVSLYPDHGKKAGILLQHAEIALALSKRSGKGCLHVYNSNYCSLKW